MLPALAAVAAGGSARAATGAAAAAAAARAPPALRLLALHAAVRRFGGAPYGVGDSSHAAGGGEEGSGGGVGVGGGGGVLLPLRRSALPARVKIVEVGPRDGLQNEPGVIDTAVKVELIHRLQAAGLTAIEAGSMVSKAWVPAMGDSAAVLAGVERRPGVRLCVLVPNAKGLDAALEAGADEVAVFAAATDAFSLKNINVNVMDSLARFRPVVAAARARGLPVRGYVSCAMGCPYSGPVPPAAVGHVAAALRDMGCYEISLGDTIGVGTPWATRRMLHGVVHDAGVHVSRLALHAHDTYGSALANVAAALECGVSVVDASVAGLGGCPYAGGGASGNVATEDVVYMLHGLGIDTGVDLDVLVEAGGFIASKVSSGMNRSKAGAARLARKKALAAAAAAGKDTTAASIALQWPEQPSLRPEEEWAEAQRAREQRQHEEDFRRQTARAGGGRGHVDAEDAEAASVARMAAAAAAATEAAERQAS
jgi:hydroxymethylglutaryl-CoA lyase